MPASPLQRFLWLPDECRPVVSTALKDLPAKIGKDAVPGIALDPVGVHFARVIAQNAHAAFALIAGGY